MSVDISVVIPCLNRERFIDDAIASALAQGEGVEVIIVDDGSTDRSRERIQAYGGQVVAIEGEGKGPSAARNRGLAAATGRFVHFLDSDDRIAPGSLRTMLGVAEQLAPAQIAVGDSINIDEEGRVAGGPTRGYTTAAGPGAIPRTTILSRPMSTPLPLFPAAVLRRIGGFDERLRHLEDRELAIRLLAEGHTFVRVPVIVSEVREHRSDRLSVGSGEARFDHMLTAFRAMADRLSKDATFIGSRNERAAFAALCWSAGRDAARARCEPVAEALFDLAQSIAGREAQSGHWLLRQLYKVMRPYAAEQFVQAVKQQRQRLRETS